MSIGALIMFGPNISPIVFSVWYGCVACSDTGATVLGGVCIAGGEWLWYCDWANFMNSYRCWRKNCGVNGIGAGRSCFFSSYCDR